MVPNIDVNRYRRCFQDSRNVDRGKLQKLGLGSYLKPKMSPVLKDTSSACARRGSPTQPCSAAALTSPSASGLPPQIRRADVTMPDRDRGFEATGGGKSCPAEVAVASPVAAVRSESDSGCPPPLSFPLWALLRTHSLARRAHFTVTPSLPAGSLARRPSFPY